MKMIPHSRPSLGNEEKKACAQAIDSLYLASGPRVEAFEKAFARQTGRRYGTAVSSGTAALVMALKALNVRAGEHAAMPSYTCAALLHAAEFCGVRPLLADIEAEDMNLSAASLKKNLRKKTGAVIVPHLFGRAADMKAILKLGLPVIEDGTQALGAEAFGKPVGSFGEVSIFSFYATKMMTTGEGGMLVTDSPKLADALRDMRDYDKKKNYAFRMNFKMSDLQAALGIEQLKKLPAFVRSRLKIAAMYDKLLDPRQKHSGMTRNLCHSRALLAGISACDDESFILPATSPERDSVYFRYVLQVSGGAGRLIRGLNQKGIEAKSPVFQPLHRTLNLADSRFPKTVRAMRDACSLPIFPDLTKASVSRVVREVLSREG